MGMIYIIVSIKVSILRSSDDLLIEGGQMELICSTDVHTSYFNLTMNWYCNNERVYNNGNMVVAQFANYSTLTILHLSGTDNGVNCSCSIDVEMIPFVEVSSTNGSTVISLDGNRGIFLKFWIMIIFL